MLPEYRVPGGIAFVKPAGYQQFGSPVYEISMIRVDHWMQRRGIGKSLLKLVCERADILGVVLILTVSGREGGWMSDVGLMHWYARYGFEIDHGFQMIRLPTDSRKPQVFGDPFGRPKYI